MKENMQKEKRFGTYDIVIIGLMAALCFAAIYIKVDVPTPMGKTMVHLGNVFCLLSGMLLGGVRGGLNFCRARGVLIVHGTRGGQTF